MKSSFEPMLGEPGNEDAAGSGFAAVPWLAASSRSADFAPLQHYTRADSCPAASEGSPLDVAIEQARREGEDAGRAAAYAELAEMQEAHSNIALPIMKLDTDMRAALATLLNEAVAALCETIFQPLAIDTERLAERCQIVANTIDDGYAEACLRLHPDDIALLGSSDIEPSRLKPDATLTRGTIILEGESGEVHDGPDEWRDRLREALGLC